MYNLVDYAMIQIIPFTATGSRSPHTEWVTRDFEWAGWNTYCIWIIIRAITRPRVMIPTSRLLMGQQQGQWQWQGEDNAHFCYHQHVLIPTDRMISNSPGNILGLNI